MTLEQVVRAIVAATPEKATAPQPQRPHAQQRPEPRKPPSTIDRIAGWLAS